MLKGNNMATEDRGFASMDPEDQKEIARKGGRSSHGSGSDSQDSEDDR